MFAQQGAGQPKQGGCGQKSLQLVCLTTQLLSELESHCTHTQPHVQHTCLHTYARVPVDTYTHCTHPLLRGVWKTPRLGQGGLCSRCPAPRGANKLTALYHTDH